MDPAHGSIELDMWARVTLDIWADVGTSLRVHVLMHPSSI